MPRAGSTKPQSAVRQIPVTWGGPAYFSSSNLWIELSFINNFTTLKGPSFPLFLPRVTKTAPDTHTKTAEEDFPLTSTLVCRDEYYECCECMDLRFLKSNTEKCTEALPNKSLPDGQAGSLDPGRTTRSLIEGVGKAVGRRSPSRQTPTLSTTECCLCAPSAHL